MKKLSLIVSLFVVILLAVSCKSEKKEAAPIGLQPEMQLDKKDTTKVLELARQMLDLAKSGDLDAAVGMLYALDKDDKIVSLPSDQAQQQKQMLTQFPVKNYFLDGVTFYKEDDCELKYTIEFTEAKDGQKPATVKGMFRPVRQDGQWYLTPANLFTEKQSQIELKQQRR